ncbi:MAG: ubiquinol-cytochrome c reductase iron-sulfur subunit [Solirubrobacteraceae bacterium]
MTDDPEHKPKTTVDAKIPGAYEGETVTRRRFMTGSAHTAGAIATAAFTLPAIGMAAGPMFEKEDVRWEAVGPTEDFPDDTYVPRTMTISPGIGEVGKTTVYVRKYNADLDSETKDEYNDYVAITSRCMHLGCPVRYVEASENFICPCHGGVYDIEGKVSDGPPVRPLDRFYTRVRDGIVEVGPRYSLDSNLERFSPRDPGQPIDGIGQYVYPSRPSIRKLPDT